MKLSQNFNLSEFTSKCGSLTPVAVVENLKKLAESLEVLRGHVGLPIRINSGYRSPEYNKKIGGAKKSQHLLGTGADFVVSGMTPRQVCSVIEELILQGKMVEGGLKAYSTFTHYDIRGIKARW